MKTFFHPRHEELSSAGLKGFPEFSFDPSSPGASLNRFNTNKNSHIVVGNYTVSRNIENLVVGTASAEYVHFWSIDPLPAAIIVHGMGILFADEAYVDSTKSSSNGAGLSFEVGIGNGTVLSANQRFVIGSLPSGGGANWVLLGGGNYAWTGNTLFFNNTAVSGTDNHHAGSANGFAFNNRASPSGITLDHFSASFQASVANVTVNAKIWANISVVGVSGF